MKRLNAVRPIFWLGIMFAIVFLVRAESGDKRTSMPNTKSASPRLRIFDQSGQPDVNGVPSPNGAIFDVAVGQDGDVFTPDTVNISVGDTVR
jgi:plastocyanin